MPVDYISLEEEEKCIYWDDGIEYNKMDQVVNNPLIMQRSLKKKDMVRDITAIKTDFIVSKSPKVFLPWRKITGRDISIKNERELW